MPRNHFFRRCLQIVSKGNNRGVRHPPGHTPLLTGIAPGSVLLEMEDGTEEIFYASGGYIEVQPDMVTLLADTALRAKDLDEAGGGALSAGSGKSYE